MVEAVEARKLAIVTGLYGSGAGGEDLSKVIKDVDKRFEELKAEIYGGGEEDIPWDDPFFKPVRKNLDLDSGPAAQLYGISSIVPEKG